MIKIENNPFTFYSLYMNLAPQSEYPEYDSLFKTDGKIHGNAVDEEEAEFYVSKIGKPGKDKKYIYFDYAVLSKENILEYSAESGKRLFWNIYADMTFYKRIQDSTMPKIKIFIPKWTEVDCTEYPDIQLYKITIKSVQVYLSSEEDVTAEGILKTDVSGITFSQAEDINNPTEDQAYISNKIKVIIDGLRGQKVAYTERTDFRYITVTLENPIIVWTDREVTVNEYTKKTGQSDILDGYGQCPYKFQQADAADTIKETAVNISDNPAFDINAKRYYQVESDSVYEEEYFITESDKNRCFEFANKFDKWFYLYTESDSIVCNRTALVEAVINWHDAEIKKFLLAASCIGIWWTGPVLIWTFFKYMLGELSRLKASKEAYYTKIELRKVICRHPVEWDKCQFENISEQCFVGKTIEENLVRVAAATDLWNGGLQKIFESYPYFYNPIYFISHLEKAQVFEFNPYEGKTYREIYNTANDICQEINMDTKVVDNPGFAPVYTPEKQKNIDGWAGTNGFFNQDYRQDHEKWKKYYHEGVDFAGVKGTPIKAFIYGEVIDFGTHNNRHGTTGMGDYMIVRDGRNKNKYYLLLHLNWNSWERYGISIGTQVWPGLTVAEVGTQDSKEAYHLHISVIILEQGESPLPGGSNTTDDAIIRNKNYVFPIWDSTHKAKMRNPFNHSEEWKGREAYQ